MSTHAEGGQELPHQSKKKVYIPGISRQLKEGEVMEYDPAAYKMFQTFQTTFPCLSFDVLDEFDDQQTGYPLSCHLVAGTQAERAKDNELITIHLSNMKPISQKLDADEDDDDGDESVDNDDKCVFRAAIIPHFGNINRLKCRRIGSSHISAVWNEQHGVQMWDMTSSLSMLNSSEGSGEFKNNLEKPLFTFSGHSAEGFALSWSTLNSGIFASGDVRSKIFLWKMSEDGRWIVDQRALTDHTASIEDLQWSPTEESLLLSCSADRYIRLWDTRSSPKQACVCSVQNAHDDDVNVISWNKFEPLIVSGGDDAATNVWSLKTMQYNQPVARFKHHKGPITSVEWSPNDSTTFMASGEDDQVTFWDLSLEKDDLDDENNEERLINDIPPQLLFVHMGQKEIKEVHWHPKIQGLVLTTALDGFHIFQTVNI